MPRRGRVVPCLLVLSACASPPRAPAGGLDVFWKVGGHYVPSPAGDRETRRQAVMAQFAEDFACSAVSLEDLAPRPLVVAHGCGRDALYLAVVHTELSATDYAEVVRFVNIAAPVSTAGLAAPLLRGTFVLNPGGVEDDVEKYRALVVAGARTLGCPEAAVVPERVWRGVRRNSPGPLGLGVVEGCGKRVVFDEDPASAHPVSVVPAEP